MSAKPTILVTGASRGIGLAVVSILINDLNANVVALSRSRSPELVNLVSDSLVIVDGDVTDATAVENAVSAALERFSGLDGLVLNAAQLEPLCRIGDDTSLEHWKHHFDVNFFSLVTALKAALPALRKSSFGGRVVFVSSGAAVKGTAGWGPYNASKAAMNSLCRTLAEEEPDVTAIALRPGMVNTSMQASLRQDGAAHMAPKDHAAFVAAHTDGKLLQAGAPGHVIAALAVRAAKTLSGQFVSWDAPDCADYRMTALVCLPPGIQVDLGREDF